MVAASAETKYGVDEIESIDVSYILRKVEETAEQFEQKFSQNFFETLHEGTKKTGQVVDAGGKPLTNELIVEMLSKMQVDFERSPHGDLTMVSAPGMSDTFQRLERELRENSEVQRKLNDIMEKKRNDFREREINRNLVG
jgi:hypothetical protein